MKSIISILLFISFTVFSIEISSQKNNLSNKSCGELKQAFDQARKTKNTESIISISSEYIKCLEKNGDTSSYDYAYAKHQKGKALKETNKLKESILILLEANELYKEVVFDYRDDNTKIIKLLQSRILTIKAFNNYNFNSLKKERQEFAKVIMSDIDIKHFKRILSDNSINPYYKINYEYDCAKFFLINYDFNDPKLKKYTEKAERIFNDTLILSNKVDYEEEDSKKKDGVSLIPYKLVMLAYNLRTKSENWQLSEKFYKKYLEKSVEYYDEDSLLANTYKDLGVFYYHRSRKNNEYSTDVSSIQYYQKALEKYEVLGNVEKVIEMYTNKGLQFYVIAQNTDNQNLKNKYYKLCIKDWELGSDKIKFQFGEFHHRYIKQIRNIKTVCEKIGDFEAIDKWNKSLLAIENEKKHPLDFQIKNIDVVNYKKNGFTADYIALSTSNGWIYKYEKLNKRWKETKWAHLKGDDIKHLTINKTGHYILTVGSHELKLWNKNGDDLSSIKCHDINCDNIKSIAFHKDCNNNDNNSFSILYQSELNNLHVDYFDFKINNSIKKLDSIQIKNRKFIPENYIHKGFDYNKYDKEFKKSKYEYSDIEQYYFVVKNNKFLKSIDNLNNQNDSIKILSKINDLDIVANEVGDLFVYTANVNGKVNLYDSKLTKYDSIDVRTKPKLYFVSFNFVSTINEESIPFYNKLKNEVLLHKNNSIDSVIISFNINRKTNKDSVINFFNSLEIKVHEKDYIIYTFYGFDNKEKVEFDDSTRLTIEEVLELSEKPSSHNKMYFVNSIGNLPNKIKRRITDEIDQNRYFQKQNRVIISEQEGHFLSKTYLSSDKLNLLNLFENNHKIRVKEINRFYNAIGSTYNSHQSNKYMLKTYFEKDGFEKYFDFSNEPNIDNSKKVKSKETICVLLGIANYPKIINGSLNTPINDVNSIESSLTKYKFKKIFKFKDLENKEFEDTLTNILNQYQFKEGSQFLFYFAGHGEKKFDNPAILFKDSEQGSNGIWENAMELEAIIKLINAIIKNKSEVLTKKLFIIDACNQGANITQTNTKEIETNSKEEYSFKEINDYMRDEVNIVISSSSGNNKSPDGKVISPFCKNISKVLNNNELKVYSNHELFDEILIKDKNHYLISIGGSSDNSGRARFFLK